MTFAGWSGFDDHGSAFALLASITSQITAWVAAHGVPAVFLLMAVDAVLPIGGELVMLYAGVIAAGAVHGSSVGLFGSHVTGGAAVFVVLSLSGALGSLAGVTCSQRP